MVYNNKKYLVRIDPKFMVLFKAIACLKINKEICHFD